MPAPASPYDFGANRDERRARSPVGPPRPRRRGDRDRNPAAPAPGATLRVGAASERGARRARVAPRPHPRFPEAPPPAREGRRGAGGRGAPLPEPAAGGEEK